MKKIILALLVVFFSQAGFSQNTDKNFVDTINAYFEEVRVATKDNYSLWNMDLYAPLMLIDPDTRKIYTNEQDSAATLTPIDLVYTGILPPNVNFANTAINWNGKKWAMVMLPLSPDKSERINLLSHELFHVAQPRLGFNMLNTDNNHLDQKNGRIYLRLELEALKNSILSENKEDQKKHLINAFIFRKYRNKLYPQSVISENKLELNEGIAEYTGQVISGRNQKQATDYLSRSFDLFMSNPTYVRSFAYQTIPGYGFLLRAKNRSWNKEVSAEINLIDYFIKELNITLPENLDLAVNNMQELYNGSRIIEEEMKREEIKLQQIARYKQIFIEEPHLIVPLEKMSISFNPSNIIPLGDDGNVYPTATISDNWGVLTVNRGMLLSPNWKTVYLSVPLEETQNHIAGEGWSIDLKNGYKVLKDAKNYILSKE
ncbi:hypothetical protein GGR21_002195 [Dysgonomonas hofstadii]|uniref:Peptidase MA superfamily protein n=1 Tax=Dysgonomonas hofstadii TaxID=637886 RepID=A0A840CWS2_9BACT|nr:hypothetical protein [Dysgonomonas hofstadii]MBB4036293.1 hypothetical protein [Dysgonomonas hofstadii]